MSASRTNVFTGILKGTLAAALITLVAMLLIAAFALFFKISDAALLAVNQLVKILSIILGVRIAVGRGGRRGFFTGTVVALLYMISGYVLYVSLGGAYDVRTMLGEMLLGAAVGSVAGAVCANMKTSSHRAKRS